MIAASSDARLNRGRIAAGDFLRSGNDYSKPIDGGSVFPPRIFIFAFIFVLVSLTLLDRFGLRISASYSINPSLMAFYGLLAAMLFGKIAQLNLFGAALYAFAMVVAAASFLVNATFDIRQLVSTTSFLLLIVLYTPFIFALRPGVGVFDGWRWVVRWFIYFSVFLSICGVVQYLAQFVFRAPWLFDFRSYIPEAIRGSGLYNTSNAMGRLIKSNGFFLREASGFSFYMAFALVCELSLFHRKWIMVVLAAGVLVSYSGSGPVILLTALLFPLGLKTLIRVIVFAFAAAVFVALFGDALNLSYTLGRVGEFESNVSSAYCRFIAPGKLVMDQIDSDTWVTLLGHGPGTTQKISTVCETTYGKVLFEYGLLGGIAFSAIIFSAVSKHWIPIRIRAALIVQWYMLGGNLLGPESLLLIYFISGIWPKSVDTASGAEGAATSLKIEDESDQPHSHSHPQSHPITGSTYMAEKQ